MKTCDSSWVYLLFALGVLGAYFFKDVAVLRGAIKFYKFLGIFSIVVLIPIIHYAYNKLGMWDLMVNLINSEERRVAACEKFAKGRFMTIPIFLHICVGIFFLYVVRDTALSLSFIGIMFYHRVIYLIISMVTVRHLGELDDIIKLGEGELRD